LTAPSKDQLPPVEVSAELCDDEELDDEELVLGDALLFASSESSPYSYPSSGLELLELLTDVVFTLALVAVVAAPVVPRAIATASTTAAAALVTAATVLLFRKRAFRFRLWRLGGGGGTIDASVTGTPGVEGHPQSTLRG
jgi:hypothetical protein